MSFYKKNHWCKIFITFFKLMKNTWPVIIFLALKFNDYIIEITSISIVLILAFSVVKWFNTSILIEENFLIYREGAILKEEMVIPLRSISLIELEINVIYRIFKLRKIKIDSVYPSSKKNAEIIMVLKKRELESLYGNLSYRMRNLIHYEREINQTLVYNILAIHLILLSMLRNNILLGIGGLYSSIHFMSKIYKGLNQELISFFKNVIEENVISRDTILAIFLSALFLFSILLLVILIFSVLAILSKYYKFTIYRNNNYLKVEYGLITRRSYSIPMESIHAVKIEQNIINQIFKFYTIKCCVVGYGNSIKEDELIFPLCNEKGYRDILKNLIPEFIFEGQVYRPEKKDLRRFFTIPIQVALYSSIGFFLLTGEIWPLLISVPVVIIERTLLYKNTKIGFGKDLYYVSYKSLNRRQIFIKRSSMEEIRVTSNPLQIRKKLGNFKLRFYSQKKLDWIKLKNLKLEIYDELKKWA
ncbi:PH domain-containing protein [Clostridium perfringens]|uniref:PH domain-containing protein n=1 Tax=Clostridium perfringens TaxID=1502 RepID=UPI0032DB9CF8|nr:PH domain-containing protein [Clostridium perfringens]MDM0479622.1 PH domain-containing protein [Clostridium perfringens]